MRLLRCCSSSSSWRPWPATRRPSSCAEHAYWGRHRAAAMAADPEGFDAVADTVGAGIYSGRVKRGPDGAVQWGPQYAGHNPVPGPVYAGGGYTDMANAIHAGPDAVRRLLEAAADPQAAANEVMTGGARPLHTCGMSRTGQLSTQLLIDAGAEVEAVDTYGYTPLHRMASNNLAKGARALLEAGADPGRRSGAPYAGEAPLDIALASGAHGVAAVLREYLEQRR
ncbi:MAG: hypothetical protein J3K34DRAFT_425265 [Monoraphidium minutum]|nr:MAG: hypothetical protein J3K34DRAFT_425265 [Monoraphidium minutum]